MSGPADPATCPACGSPVWHAETEGGERVPLEPQPELLGEDRYTVTEVRPGQPHIVRAVMPHASIQAYRDHRIDCPDYRNGI